jgi:tRNA(Ile)-lysidine synthase
VETLLINLLRGTGIKGLKGIPEKTGRIVRPLLNFTKTDILKYAETETIRYRTDKSNLEPKYERNFLRLKVIPLLKELHPSLDQVMLNNVRNFREEAELVQEALVKRSKKMVEHKKGLIYLDKVRLAKDPYCRSLLHYLLAPYGFNASQLEDLEENIRRSGLVGKLIKAPAHTLTIDRKHLVIKENAEPGFKPMTLSGLKELGKVDFLQVSRLKSFKKPDVNELVVERDRLVFPLSIRGIAKGDRFKPFGMKGFKLLSDFLKDQKLNNFDKEKCKLLINGNGDIIWVLGYRSDERYKVSPTGKDLIKLSLLG